MDDNKFYQAELGREDSFKRNPSKVKVAKLDYLEIPAGEEDFFEAIISFVQSWDTFFVNLPSAYAVMRRLRTELEKAYSTKNIMVNPVAGDIGIVKLGLSDEYYRVLILKRLDPVLVKVFFVDYGNIEEVDIRIICKLPQNASSAPAQAIALKAETASPIKGTTMTLQQFREFMTGTRVTIKLRSDVSKRAFLAEIYVYDTRGNYHTVDMAVNGKIRIPKKAEWILNYESKTQQNSSRMNGPKLALNAKQDDVLFPGLEDSNPEKRPMVYFKSNNNMHSVDKNGPSNNGSSPNFIWMVLANSLVIVAIIICILSVYTIARKYFKWNLASRTTKTLAISNPPTEEENNVVNNIKKNYEEPKRTTDSDIKVEDVAIAMGSIEDTEKISAKSQKKTEKKYEEKRSSKQKQHSSNSGGETSESISNHSKRQKGGKSTKLIEDDDFYGKYIEEVRKAGVYIPTLEKGKEISTIEIADSTAVKGDIIENITNVKPENNYNSIYTNNIGKIKNSTAFSTLKCSRKLHTDPISVHSVAESKLVAPKNCLFVNNPLNCEFSPYYRSRSITSSKEEAYTENRPAINSVSILNNNERLNKTSMNGTRMMPNAVDEGTESITISKCFTQMNFPKNYEKKLRNENKRVDSFQINDTESFAQKRSLESRKNRHSMPSSWFRESGIINDNKIEETSEKNSKVEKHGNGQSIQMQHACNFNQQHQLYSSDLVKLAPSSILSSSFSTSLSTSSIDDKQIDDVDSIHSSDLEMPQLSIVDRIISNKTSSNAGGMVLGSVIQTHNSVKYSESPDQSTESGTSLRTESNYESSSDTFSGAQIRNSTNETSTSRRTKGSYLDSQSHSMVLRSSESQNLSTEASTSSDSSHIEYIDPTFNDSSSRYKNYRSNFVDEHRRFNVTPATVSITNEIQRSTEVDISNYSISTDLQDIQVHQKRLKVRH